MSKDYVSWIANPESAKMEFFVQFDICDDEHMEISFNTFIYLFFLADRVGDIYTYAKVVERIDLCDV